MDQDTKKQLEELAGYVMHVDARLMAIQLSICEVLELSDEQKNRLNDDSKLKLNGILRKMGEELEDYDPELAARLLNGHNPYSTDG